MTCLPMFILLPIVLFLSIYTQINLIRPLEPAAARIHAHCVHVFSDAHRPHDLSASFICGKKVTHSAHKNLLQKSGLYHAIVVSGGHFLFIESLLKRIQLPYLARMVVLLFYYLATHLQAPGLRCLMQLNLGHISQRWHLKLSSPVLCFYSGLACLAINVDLWQSLSFWLSLAVSLALAFAQELKTQNNKAISFFLPLICIYIFLIPFNFTNGYLHPLNLVLGAIFLYPFCIFLLFSAGLILGSRAFPTLSFDSLLEPLNNMVFLFLKYSTQIVPNKNFGSFDLFYLWIYLLISIVSFHMLTLHFRRETIRE